MRFQVALVALGAAASIQTAAVAQTGNLWGVNGSNAVWRWNGAAWAQLPGAMKQVSVAADGSAWAIDPAGAVFSWSGTAWQPRSGGLTQISAGSMNNVWGVNAANQVWRWDGALWSFVPGRMKQVSAASDGTVWGIDLTNGVFSWTGSDWQQKPGALVQISAGSANNVWGVNTSNVVYRWDGSKWTQMPGTMKQVSVAADGSAWAIDTTGGGFGGGVYYWSGVAWKLFSGSLVNLSAALAGPVEETYPALKFVGSWTRLTNAAASGGGFMVSSVIGNTLTYTFSGDSIAIYRSLDTNGGEATVTIDGQPHSSLSFNFQEPRWKVPAVLDRLGAGQHTMVLTVSGPAGKSVYVDYIAAPVPFQPSAEQQTALARVNVLRTTMGLPPAALSTAINLAAQAHADYNGTKGVSGHDQTLGQPGFVGATHDKRMAYFGYDTPASEDAAQGTGAAEAVDGWMTTVYHRLPIVRFGFTDIGFGFNRKDPLKPMTVLDFGAKRATSPGARLISTYPADDQADVPLKWTNEEIPNPLPVVPSVSNPVGYPISLHITLPAGSQNGTGTGTNLGELFDSAGKVVPIYYRDRKVDTSGFIGSNDFFIVPQKPLKVAETYKAHIKGNDSAGVAFDVTWNFTTVPATYLNSAKLNSAAATNAFVMWETAGPVTSEWVEYGTTTAYGSRALRMAGTVQMAYLSGLTPNTTYHFRVVAQDAAGNSGASGDVTFVTTP